MESEIQKIMEMVKSGTITPEQGAELVQEVAAGSPSAHKTAHSERKRGFFGLAEHLAGRFSSEITGLYPSDLKENKFSMSRVQAPSGRQFVFRDNVVRMSSMSDLCLDEADFVNCSLNMSSVSGLTVKHGRAAELEAHASSLEEVHVEEGELKRCRISSSHMREVKLNKSSMDNVNFNASTVKSLSLADASAWSDSTMDASSVNRLELSASNVSALEIDGSNLSHIRLERTRLDQVLVRFLKMSQTTLLGCAFKDVLFSSTGDSWRKTGFDRVTMENVNWEKVLFSDCALKKVTIKNVTLSNLKVINVRLSDAVIDGNGQFLEVCGLVGAAAGA